MSDELRQRADAALTSFYAAAPGGIAVDTETSGLHFYDEAFCVTVAWYNPIGQVDAHYIDLKADTGYDAAAEILAVAPALVFHNAKFDLQKLVLARLIDPTVLQPIHDTQTLAHLADEHQPLGLKKLAAELLGEQTNEEEALGAWFKEKKIKKADRDYSALPPDVLIPYAVKDAEFTIRLFRKLYPQVAKHSDLMGLYDLEMALTTTLLRMEARGMAVDVDYLERTTKEYANRILSLEIDIRKVVGDDDFNPGSWQQVQAVFAAKGITLDDTSAATLAGVDDPLAAQIVELRELRKIHGTYLVGLLAEQRGGIVHPWFNSSSTRTGRMSSSGASA